MTQQKALRQGDRMEARALRRITAAFERCEAQAMDAAQAFFDALARTLDNAPAVIAADQDRLKRWRMAQGETLLREHQPDRLVAAAMTDATLEAEAEAEATLTKVYEINHQATVDDIDKGLSPLGLSLTLLTWARTSQGLPPVQRAPSAQRKTGQTGSAKGAEKPRHGTLMRFLDEVEVPLTPGRGRSASVPLFSSLPARVQDAVLLEIKRGIREGEGQPKIMRRVQKVVRDMPAWKARQIVQTERTRIQSRARFDASEAARAEGLDMDREWVARFHHTRDSHKQLHGQIARAGEPFHSPLGSIMYYPGDRSHGAPGRDTINCHCHTRELLRSASPALEAIRRRTSESREAWLERTRQDGTYNRWRDSVGR